MNDKWYGLRCRMALAHELGIAPDDIIVEPIMELLESSHFYGDPEDIQVNFMPETPEQHEAVISNHYDIISQRIFNNEAPFEGYLMGIFEEKGII